ncbi:putative zinc finger motif, C2HC5-type [Geosmithia morbida]|uniref:Zinc finger motif, C2HC5-type n=1 Tax=Geosmithia morbida TaxID=1094350 RepID=A0A9P4Z142_9HYPO|nr:putative zinc finger motif, C2HC5-type [Geosmithia morbida]KAF4125499.1 putative zinc finger motif, C2HC5-type [Geosmithia morbida]
MSLAQLSQLLPLQDSELQQVLDYAATLSKSEAVSHFSNLLGDSPEVATFIATFNSRRKDPYQSEPATASRTTAALSTAGPSSDRVPKLNRQSGKKKKQAQIHTPEARQVNDYGAPSGTVYSKKQTDLEYIPRTTQQHNQSSTPSSNNASRPGTPKPAAPSAAAPPPAPKQQPASAGYLISDVASKSKSKSALAPKGSAPKPAKVSISGGTPMAGQSTALADLEAAIRALEITTNPKLDSPDARRCNCVATRHPLQGAAPNCLSCGKVICLKEGLGPCTFCGTPLLSRDEVQSMMRELKEERGREKMAADAKAHRRPEVSKAPAPFTKRREGPMDASLSEAEAKAREHRDRLLGFQAQNAQRTTVHDEAADFDVGTPGTGSMWATPEDRARELKRQQKMMREMEWNARPDYEKRQQVVSIDLVGGKVVRRMANKERPSTPDEEDDDSTVAQGGGVVLSESTGNRSGGAFSSNPLLGALIKPVFDAKGKGADAEGRPQKKGWRRVQDDLENNEHVILDGGVYGGGASDEPERG